MIYLYWEKQEYQNTLIINYNTILLIFYILLFPVYQQYQKQHNDSPNNH